MKPEVKKDCFGYHSTGGKPICSCLTDMVCRYRTCSFYKPLEQYTGDLINLHGTTDTQRIEKAYIERKGLNADA